MLDRFGTADQEALYLVAFLGGEKFQLRLSFDPFRDDRNGEAARQPDDGAHDGCRFARRAPGWR